MKPGKHVFYTIQGQITHRSPWLKLGPLEPVPAEDQAWFFLSFGTFGNALDPWTSTYGEKLNPAASKEIYAVNEATGKDGWWTKAYARDALTRVSLADLQGFYDVKDSCDRPRQAVRHAFRLVRIVLDYKISVNQ